MLLKRALALLLVALVLPYACAPIYRFPESRPFSGARLYNPYDHLHGTWHLANLHAHGRAWNGLTNGRQSDADVVQAYRARGYDVAGISDYFQIAAHSGVKTMALYEHGFNIGKHHQIAIGARKVEWFDLPLWQGASQKQYVLNRVGASAALVALAHPSIMPGGYTRTDLEQLTGYQLFELVNGRFTAEDLWDTALSSGRAVWAIGDDDTHDVTDPERMAVAWNMIDAPSSRSEDIISALRDGRSYAVSRIGGTPDRSDASLSSVAVANGIVTITCSAPATISFIGQSGRMLRSVPDATTASHTFAPDDAYVRFVIRTPHTEMFLNPVIRYDGDLNRPAAAIDETKTRAMRAALVLGCATLLLSVWWRPRGDRGSIGASDRSSLKRASSFVLALVAATILSGPARAQRNTDRRWAVGGRLTSQPHDLAGDCAVRRRPDAVSSTIPPGFSGGICKTIDGVPAFVDTPRANPL